MGQYLSTDPNAGKPVAPGGYLSTDPNAGEKADFTTSNETDSEGNPVINALSRFGSSFARNILPSTTASDYIEGPLYAAQHPIDSAGLILRAMIDAHKQQGSKTVESFGRIGSEPTLGGKVGALSQTLGHAAATALPVIGPAAANAGEQLGEGDVAGGLGSMAGLLTPNVIGAARTPGARLKQMASDRLHQSAIEGVQKAINPTRIDTKVRTERIAPEMLERRVSATSLPKLEELAATESAAAGAKVDQALQPHMSTTANTMDLVDQLEKAKAPYLGKTTSGQVVVNDPTRVKAISKLQDTLMEYGADISVESMVKMRRNWDQVVEAGKGFTTEKPKLRAWAAREGRSALRDALNQAVPDLKAVNAEYSFWQTLEDVTSATNERKVGQNGSLLTTIAGGAGAVAGEMMAPGSSVAVNALGAAAGAKGFASLKRLLDSPGYRLMSAVQKERLADALASRNPAKIRPAIQRGLIAVARFKSGTETMRPVPSHVPAAAGQPQRDEQVRR